MKSAHIEIYASEETDFRGSSRQMWRWRFRASNGKILSQSSEAYNDPRDLVRGLELSHPGSHLRRRGNRSDWWLFYAGGSTSPTPVRVPKGTEHLWSQRRKGRA